MHCVYTQTNGELRIFFNDNGYEQREEYDAIINVMWVKDTVVKLRGAHGKFTKQSMLAAYQACEKLGATHVIADRAKGRKLPFADLVETGEYENVWQVNLLDLKAKGLI